jgi:hypothetical protein
LKVVRGVRGTLAVSGYDLHLWKTGGSRMRKYLPLAFLLLIHPSYTIYRFYEYVSL